MWSAKAQLSLFLGGSGSFRSFVFVIGRRSCASARKSESCVPLRGTLHMGRTPHSPATVRRYAGLLLQSPANSHN